MNKVSETAKDKRKTNKKRGAVEEQQTNKQIIKQQKIEEQHKGK